MPEIRKKKRMRISVFRNTLSFRVAFRFDDESCLGLTVVSSVISVVVINSSEFDVLSFKLRRRTGCLRIFLQKTNKTILYRSKNRKNVFTENSIFVYYIVMMLMSVVLTRLEYFQDCHLNNRKKRNENIRAEIPEVIKAD